MSRERLRDPIHGLIVFDTGNSDDNTDKLAWDLIQTPEFQRLRRIKQLGVSELTFPGATHSRFIHSIGVYHNARRLMKVVERAREGDFDREKAKVVLLGSLLHDIGHGPFSHSFEEAREAIADGEPIKNHEWFTGEIIRDPLGKISEILPESLLSEIAALFSVDDPSSIYHSVLTSSFDADRLDYLERDRRMTGIGGGAIDVDWLIDTLTVGTVQLSQDDDEPHPSETFVFREKGRAAAEDFLLGRYRLYSQLYLHKTTRGFGCALTALMKIAGKAIRSQGSSKLGIPSEHPIVRFLSKGGDTLENYKALDDTVVWSAIEGLRSAQDRTAKKLAAALWDRNRLKCLEVFNRCSAEELPNLEWRIDAAFQTKLGATVFKDSPRLNLYASMRGEEGKSHKIVRVIDGSHNKEITEFPDTVISETLQTKKRLLRYFFLDQTDWEDAQKIIQGG